MVSRIFHKSFLTNIRDSLYKTTVQKTKSQIIISVEKQLQKSVRGKERKVKVGKRVKDQIYVEDLYSISIKFLGHIVIKPPNKMTY